MKKNNSKTSKKKIAKPSREEAPKIRKIVLSNNKLNLAEVPE